MLRLLLLSLTLCAASQKLEGEPYTWTDEKLGVSITLPDKKWQVSDRSQGVAKVLIFSPSEDIRTRCTVLHLPAAILPEGLLSREAQIKSALGDGYKRVAYETDTLGGKEARRLEYAAAGTTTLEYGLGRDDFYLIFQLCAPDAKWKDAASKAALEKIKQSFTFTGEARVETPEADLSTPDEVRARRKATSKRGPAEFEISQHELRVEIDPPGHSLETRDRITVRAVKEGLWEIKLRYSVVRIDDVQPQAEVDWETKQGGEGTAVLSIRFQTPMKSGQERVLTVRTSSNDFQQTVDQSLVEEIATLGQVRERSWFFEQWFFQAGCPDVAVEFSQQDNSLTVTLRQEQKQKPYRLTGELLIRGKQGQTLRRTISLTDREAKLKLEVSFPVQEILFDPDDRILTKAAAS